MFHGLMVLGCSGSLGGCLGFRVWRGFLVGDYLCLGLFRGLFGGLLGVKGSGLLRVVHGLGVWGRWVFGVLGCLGC